MREQKYVFKLAESEDEIKQYFAVRKEVFVDEQRLFLESDRDEYDNIALHIIAKEMATGIVVGTVRCYSLGEGVWVGGRLAVRKAYRGRVGVVLARTAFKIMVENDCREFYAYVQIQNVHFFERLGWSKIGESSIFHGLCHEMMKLDMNGQEEILHGKDYVRGIAIEKFL